MIRRIRSRGGMSAEQAMVLDAIEEMINRWQSMPQPQEKPRPGARADVADEPELEIRQLSREDIMQWPKEYRDFHINKEMRRTPGSSNVYSFTWIEDEPRVAFGQKARTMRRPNPTDMGTLIVTFKDWTPGVKDRPDTPGATYAYMMVPRAKWEMFVASTSPNTAGVAVWDYCRVRGTISGHQHLYRLLSVTGEYVPRRADPSGFRTRALPGAVGDLAHVRRSTLEEGPLTRFGRPVARETPLSPREWRRQLPQVNPGYTNRGSPNRGTPNRG
jgi:hypothetical protein